MKTWYVLVAIAPNGRRDYLDIRPPSSFTSGGVALVNRLRRVHAEYARLYASRAGVEKAAEKVREAILADRAWGGDQWEGYRIEVEERQI
jgi:hypothetical protein